MFTKEEIKELEREVEKSVANAIIAIDMEFEDIHKVQAKSNDPPLPHPLSRHT